MPRRVLGVLGGMDLDDGRLVAWASTAHAIYAADSGADRLIALGFAPIVIGDFDSFTRTDLADSLRLVQDLDEDTTDCDKLLALVLADGHESLTLAGVEGDLPDHVLASLSSTVSSPLRLRIAFRRGIGLLVRLNEGATVHTKQGQRVSLIPLTPCEGAVLTGVTWPLDGESLQLGGRLSVSNEASFELVTATVSSGAALLFVESQEIVW